MSALFFEALVPQGKTSFIPVEHLYLITVFIAEDENLTTKYILLQCLFHNGTQPVNGFTKIYQFTM